ncbi:type II secretion system F family protein [Protaetiibacter sp. 10F1B-8-1]|uniref:Type II secretion system F family protein n=1 Tax=Protaetiibacter mangrovi TaxID=2970926 RepID=A0ABT1ZIP2_9MICO|nr:type II secretion system F family protein [Protaetiibacter mangrovi]
MAAAWGLVLGLGLVLVAAPWLWPAAGDRVTARRAGPLARLGVLVRQAGLSRVSAPTVVAVAVLLALATAAVVVALVPVVALAVAAGLAAGALPFAVLSGRARSRRRAMRAVWPDAIDHLVAGLRSGRSLPDALAELGESGPAPLRPAFTDFGGDLRATGQFLVALDALKDRLADPVADRVVETLRVAREVGGTELPSVLRALAAHLRADAAIRSEVEARQSWVVSAARLGVAAPWLVLLLLAARPEAVRAYNSPAGVAVLAVGLVVTIVAYRLMITVGRLPEERRWFA